MNPVERPPYRVLDELADLAFEVEAADWAGLLSAATLALSDVIRPLGRFDTWTNRRVAAHGADRAEVLAAWLTEVLYLCEHGGFLPALAEVDRAEETRASGILRGGSTDPKDEPPDRVVRAVSRDDLLVVAGSEGRPWRARVAFRLGTTPLDR